MKVISIVFLFLCLVACSSIKTIVLKEKLPYQGDQKPSRTVMRLVFKTTIQCAAEKIWDDYKKPTVWLDNLKPKAHLKPVIENKNIEQWQVDQYYAFKLFMYGFAPFGKHYISFELISDEHLTMQSREHGFMVPHWDNRFQVKPLTDSSCMVIDEIIISTKGINGIVAAYARDVFKAKHKKLIKHYNK